METKEQMALRAHRQSLKEGYTHIMNIDGLTDHEWTTSDHGSELLHPLWYRIEMLYYLLKSKNGPCSFIGRILKDIKRYGIHHKVARVDLIAMNKMYKEYK